ncbi:MAG: tRNA (adenosine(37)-N6)-threonylcarbamoyltransferase complex transferase subunit TsaD [Christensenellaceae bacterium]|nr:tRNA (adenosine(37)-N6)-threonylcarbamoyltransferase complex transferase subunit TsaD [Christensenellaceae bacterium]
MSDYLERSEEKVKELVSGDDVTIMAFETSCDETACAVVKNGREVLGNSVYTQIAIHREFGGVVPEIASRNHVAKISSVAEDALSQAGIGYDGIDAVAVTCGPGLVGALLTGVAFAKGLAFALDKPLIPVNHMEGHISANYITYKDLEPPFICLVVSGGHTAILNVTAHGSYRELGTTRDDAAGEAVDKIARVLGLPYPGGPSLEKLAIDGDPHKYEFPRVFKGETHLDFSFSGMKTAAINLIRKLEQKGGNYRKEDVAASFQDAVMSSLIRNATEAVRRENGTKLVLAGGVCANSVLRKKALEAAGELGIEVLFPELRYCTDNAAMIASAAYFSMKHGPAGLGLNAYPAMGTTDPCPKGTE